MKYSVMLAGDGDVGPWDRLTPENQEAVMARFGGFDAACEQQVGVDLMAGEALEDGSTATTLRTSGDELTITDGPYSEATEHIGGCYVVSAPDLDTVIELCRSLPSYDIEIRPIVDFG